MSRLALAVALVFALQSTGRAALDERQVGRRFFLEARGSLPLIEDPAVARYVERVGRKLTDTLAPEAFEYRFFVVQSPVLNAFAVPGGYVFVFSGLLARANSEDELAGVLAHEIGHAHAHHAVRLQSAASPWTVAALLGMLLSFVHPVLGAGAMAAAQTATLHYSRDFEQEADFLGLRFATQAGYDPHALGGFFKELLSEQRLNPTGLPPYMLSHPVTEDRVSNVEATITTQKLRTPAGRPARGVDFEEAQAVARAGSEPAEVVVERYRREAQEKPDDLERQFLLGRVYQTVGQLESARTALEKVKAKGGLDGRVDRPLGSLYVALKDYGPARTSLDAYLARHPDDAFARLELGKALGGAGDSRAALKEFQRAIVLDPDLDEAHRLAGLALGRQGDEAVGFYHLGKASMLRGELEQAASQFERALPQLPPDSARRKEVEDALAELRPIVGDRERERLERDRRRRRGVS